MYNDVIYKSIFLIITIYFGLKAIAYAMYEIKTENNKLGGISVIALSILVVVFVNVTIFIR